MLQMGQVQADPGLPGYIWRLVQASQAQQEAEEPDREGRAEEDEVGGGDWGEQTQAPCQQHRAVWPRKYVHTLIP